MKKNALKNDWVTIELTLLEPEDRSENIPEDTSRHPYRAFIQGYLTDDAAEKGDTVTVRTLIGREHKGVVTDTDPKFTHDFGQPVPELLTIGQELRQALRGK